MDDEMKKQAVDTLKQSLETYHALSTMLRLMCDNVPDMIWAKDLDKRYIFANQAICTKLLNAVDTSEPVGKTDLFFAERERQRHPDNKDWHTFGELCQDSDAVTLEKGVPQQFDEFGNIRGQFLFLDVRKAPFVNEKGKIIGVVGSARDVTKAKENEKKLKKWTAELESRIKKRTRSLEEFNTTLKVLLKTREDDKNKISENINSNFTSMIHPLILQLRNTLTLPIQKEILDVLESTVRQIATPFSKHLSDPLTALTPSEIQIAGLVKQGKSNKEMAALLNKSIRAVSSHRENIRQKLGIKNHKVNLRTYLLSLA